MIKLTELVNESFKPKFRDTEKLAKTIGKDINDVVKFLKDYEVEADDLMDVIEAGGRRYHLMVIAAIGGNQRALRKLDDLLGFMG